MIETEIKFLYEEEKVAALIAGATLIGKKDVTDVYYDDTNHSLWLHDRYLRERNGVLELKLPLQDNRGEIKSYQEIAENVEDHLPKPLSTYKPIITVHTSRTSYQKDDVRVDIDVATINGKTYRVGELELINETNAKKRLNALLKAYSLTPITNGKIFLYIKDEMPELYAKLVGKGITRR